MRQKSLNEEVSSKRIGVWKRETQSEDGDGINDSSLLATTNQPFWIKKIGGYLYWELVTFFPSEASIRMWAPGANANLGHLVGVIFGVHQIFKDFSRKWKLPNPVEHSKNLSGRWVGALSQTTEPNWGQISILTTSTLQLLSLTLE